MSATAVEEVPDAAVALLAASILHVHGTAASVHGESLGLCLLARILLAVVHLLHEGLGLFLVHKGESGETWWMLELE